MYRTWQGNCLNQVLYPLLILLYVAYRLARVHATRRLDFRKQMIGCIGFVSFWGAPSRTVQLSGSVHEIKQVCRLLLSNRLAGGYFSARFASWVPSLLCNSVKGTFMRKSVMFLGRCICIPSLQPLHQGWISESRYCTTFFRLVEAEIEPACSILQSMRTVYHTRCTQTRHPLFATTCAC